MNCFQISIFAVANTTVEEDENTWALLWITFKLVSLQLQTQRRNSLNGGVLVVNCFQISIFAVANTTFERQRTTVNLLWIAFKLVSLQLQTQLSFVVIIPSLVVNCFQISIFAVANTTFRVFNLFLWLLWIAFKLVSLQLQTQLPL